MPFKAKRYRKSSFKLPGAENALFQVCLTITELLSPFYLEEMKKLLKSQRFAHRESVNYASSQAQS